MTTFKWLSNAFGWCDEHAPDGSASVLLTAAERHLPDKVYKWCPRTRTLTHQGPLLIQRSGNAA